VPIDSVIVVMIDIEREGGRKHDIHNWGRVGERGAVAYV